MYVYFLKTILPKSKYRYKGKGALKLGLKYFFDVFNSNGRIGKRSPLPFFKQTFTSQIDNNKMPKN